MASIQAGIEIVYGAGSPEGVVVGSPGKKLYVQTGGTDVGAMWTKATGTGSTGWAKLATPAPSSPAPIPQPGPPPITGKEWFVSTTGSAANAGTLASPWTLAYAASGAGGSLQSGDAVTIRGGTYTAPTITVAGTAGRPITWRNLSGERVIFDGFFQLNSKFNRVIGERLNFVCYHSAPLSSFLNAFKTNGVNGHPDAEGVELINMILHDAGGNGIQGGAWGNLFYGLIIYNNSHGTHAEGAGHGVYYAPPAESPLLRFEELCVFQNADFQFNCYDGGTQNLAGPIAYKGCIAFGVGEINFPKTLGKCFFDSRHPTQHASYKECYNFVKDGGFGETESNAIGYPATFAVSQGSLSIEDCVFYGGQWINAPVTNALKVARNRFYGMGLFRWDIRAVPTALPVWDNNIYGERNPPGWGGLLFKRSGQADVTFVDFTGWQSAFTAAVTPSMAPDQGMETSYFVSATGEPAAGNLAFARPNAFEAGRGHLIVYNWADAATVPVNLSSIVRVGDAYEIRNMQALWTTPSSHVPSTPVLSGTYSGGTVNVPMTGVTPLDPIDRVARGLTSPRYQGPRFGSFLVTKP